MGAVLALPLGLLIGAVLGLVGAGGSIIAVPALVYGVGLPASQAIPSSLIVVGLAALSAVLPRIRRGVDWPIAAMVGGAGIPAAWLGTALNRLLDPRLLLLAFSAVMVAAGVRMLRGAPAAAPETASQPWRAQLLKALVVGLIVGLLTGLFGIGGGFLITPALILLLRVRPSIAVGTSLVIIVVNSAAGFAAHVNGLALDWALVGTFTAAAIAGSLVAARFAQRLPDRNIRLIFAVMVLAVAVFVAGNSIVALLTG